MRKERASNFARFHKNKCISHRFSGISWARSIEINELFDGQNASYGTFFFVYRIFCVTTRFVCVLLDALSLKVEYFCLLFASFFFQFRTISILILHEESRSRKTFSSKMKKVAVCLWKMTIIVRRISMFRWKKRKKERIIWRFPSKKWWNSYQFNPSERSSCDLEKYSLLMNSVIEMWQQKYMRNHACYYTWSVVHFHMKWHCKNSDTASNKTGHLCPSKQRIHWTLACCFVLHCRTNQL